MSFCHQPCWGQTQAMDPSAAKRLRAVAASSGTRSIVITSRASRRARRRDIPILFRHRAPSPLVSHGASVITAIVWVARLSGPLPIGSARSPVRFPPGRFRDERAARHARQGGAHARLRCRGPQAARQSNPHSWFHATVVDRRCEAAEVHIAVQSSVGWPAMP